jgi:uncharacterized protein (DUF488 family)
MKASQMKAPGGLNTEGTENTGKARVTVWTIGHSTRGLEELIAALRGHRIEALVDVRAFPASQRNLQFSRESLERELPKAGIEYVWLGKALGGRRRAVKNSPDVALRSESFRGYAHHMRSAAFREGIEELLKLASTKRTAIMCAELLWWNCHRSMIADYLSAVRRVEVRHIRDAAHMDEHRMKAEARVEGDSMFYDLNETKRLL